MAQLMALRMPQKIQQKKMVLPFAEPGTAPYHLAVQAPHLRGATHDHTVHRGAVPAFGQQHGIAQDVVVSPVKCFQNFRPVLAFPVYLRCAEPLFVQDLFKFLAGFYKRKEYHRFTVFTVFLHLIRDLVQVRVQGCRNIARLEIPGLHGHAGQVQLQRDCQGLDRR